MANEQITTPEADRAEVDWYISRGLSTEEAQKRAAEDALRSSGEPDLGSEPRESETTEDPLQGDVDRRVHPDETHQDV